MSFGPVRIFAELSLTFRVHTHDETFEEAPAARIVQEEEFVFEVLKGFWQFLHPCTGGKVNGVEADCDCKVPYARRIVAVTFRLEEPHKDFREVICINVAWPMDTQVYRGISRIEHPASLEKGLW